MNVVGAFMWVSVGATALHYWQGYMADHDQLVVVRERVVSIDPYIEPFFFCFKNKSKTFTNFRLVWCLVHCAYYPEHFMLLTLY